MENIEKQPTKEKTFSKWNFDVYAPILTGYGTHKIVHVGCPGSILKVGLMRRDILGWICGHCGEEPPEKYYSFLDNLLMIVKCRDSEKR